MSEKKQKTTPPLMAERISSAMYQRYDSKNVFVVPSSPPKSVDDVVTNLRGHVEINSDSEVVTQHIRNTLGE